MRTITSFFVFCVLVCFSTISFAQGDGAGTAAEQSGASGTKGKGYSHYYKAFTGLAIDKEEAAPVQSLFLQKDVASFVLESGMIYLCKPIDGKRYAAVFVGEGYFSYTPPIRVEKEHLARFFGKQEMYEKFTTMVLFCGDSTLDELQAMLPFGEASSVPKAGEQALAEMLEYTHQDDYKYVSPEFLLTIMNPEKSGLFYAHFADAGQKPLFYEINPLEDEEVQFMRHTTSARGQGKYQELVNQTHLYDEYATGEYLGSKDRLSIDKHVIDCTIAENMDFSVRDEIDITMLQPKRNWFALGLFYELDVDSMFWGDGTKAEFFKDGTYNLWVRNDARLGAGEKGKLRIHYHGDMVARQYDWFYLKSSIQWYPQHGYKQKSYFDVTFHTHKRFKFVSVGDNVSNETNGETVTSHWVTRAPIRNASFNIGLFEEHRVERDSLPPIIIWISKSGHRAIAEQMIEQGYTSGSDMEVQVGEDVENAIKLFQFIYGEYPADRVYATEIPASHGEAFPGLIHMSWSTFQRSDESGFDHLFRAHEVAHQWWGIGVDFKTYHDQWLSEGFSEYAGLTYMQAVVKDNDKFFAMLKKWREKIVGNRKSIFGSGQESGPIWMGRRTNSSGTAGDYSLIIYEKGAWVLHMLRNMMMDLKTNSEDAYLGMMRDFYATYRGKEATTEDFRAMVEKHIGADMGWYFEQWVYGTAIPTYKFGHDITKTPEGKYMVKFSIQQKNVPDDFQMYIPIRVSFGKAGVARFRALIKGAGGEFEVPYDMEPEEVTFNDLESVLCEVE